MDDTLLNKNPICKLLFFILLTGYSISVLAWDHSIALGYGRSHDPNDIHYYNSGFFLNGDIFPIYHSRWMYWSINGALGLWHTTAPNHQNLTTGALALALRLYPFTTDQMYQPYLLGSAGPAILSNRRFGVNTQGSNFTIQSNLGLGLEYHCYDINLRFVHYSNANLASPNEGFNILYLLSIGYLF